VNTYNNNNVSFKVKEENDNLILDTGSWYVEIGDDFHFCVSNKPGSGQYGLYTIHFGLVDEINNGSQFLWFIYNKYKDMNDEEFKVEYDKVKDGFGKVK